MPSKRTFQQKWRIQPPAPLSWHTLESLCIMDFVHEANFPAKMTDTASCATKLAHPKVFLYQGVQTWQDMAFHTFMYIQIYIDTQRYIIYIYIYTSTGEGVYIIVWCPKMAYAQKCVYSTNLDIWFVILSPIDGTQIPNI